MRGTYLVTGNGNLQGACPTGWHEPTVAEFNTMVTAMQGISEYYCNGTSTNIAKALASTSGWNSYSSDVFAAGYQVSTNNASGFNAYPLGLERIDGTAYRGRGTEADFCTTELGTIFELLNNSTTASVNNYYLYQTKDWAFPLRCVQGTNYVPSAKTGASTSVSMTTASVNASFIRQGVSQFGVCYSSTNTNPTTSDLTTQSIFNSTANLTNLSPNTIYYYRAYATNSYGTSYGEVKSFRTLEGVTVTNVSADQIGSTNVRLQGGIIPGTVAETVQQWGFELYEKQPNGTYIMASSLSATDDTPFDAGDYHGQFTFTRQSGTYDLYLRGLKGNTTYKYKAFVYTDLRGVVYASELSDEFTTLPLPVLATVNTVRAFYPGSGDRIQMEGNVINAGGSQNFHKGFLVGLTANPTLENNYHRYDMSGSATGTYNYTATGYNTPNTTYHIRAYVMNGAGVSYGDDVTYTTPDVPTMSLSNNYTSPYYYSDNVKRTTIREGTVVVSDSGSPLTERGLLFTESISLASTEPTPATISTNYQDVLTKWVKVAASSVSTEDVTIYGFPNTDFYIKSYGTNAFGTAYSSGYRTVRTALDCGQQLESGGNHSYTTVKIGSQCWMARNLRDVYYDNTVESSGIGTSIDYTLAGYSAGLRFYYEPNGDEQTPNQYGYLYNWPAVTGLNVPNRLTGANMTTSQGRHQGICPRGWHIPSKEEFTSLKSNLSGAVYFSVFHWNQLAGWFDHTGGHPYDEFGQYLELFGWTENPNNQDEAVNMYFTSDSSKPYGVRSWVDYIDKDYGLSVRCVQDIAY